MSSASPTSSRPSTPCLDLAERLEAAIGAQDEVALNAIGEAPDVLQVQPTLAGLAVRALQQNPLEDVAPPLAPAFRRSVIQIARRLPTWPNIGAVPKTPTVNEAASFATFAWLSHAPWQGMLHLFGDGHHAGTLLQPGDEWMRLTYLSAAILLGYSDMIDFLLAATGRPDLADTDGHTPLWSACETNQLSRVVRLLQAGASPNVSNNNGDEVPLVLDAIALSSPDILRALMEHGVDLQVRDAEGFEPLDALFLRRSMNKEGPQNLHALLMLLLNHDNVACENLPHRCNLWSNVLLAQIARRAVTPHGAADRLACLSQLADRSEYLDAPAPLYKTPWSALDLADPSLPEDHRPLVSPLTACVMGRHLLARQMQQGLETIAEVPEGITEAQGALWLQISPDAARKALLDALEILLMAGASPHTQDALCQRDSVAWAALFDDDEAQARLTSPAWQAAWQPPVPPSEAEELIGPPQDDWLENLNMSRQAMRHAYGILEADDIRAAHADS